MEVSSLEFEDQMFVELLSEDGILVVAKGLGLNRIFLKFVKLHCDPKTLVVAINASSICEDHFINELRKQGTKCLPKSVTNEISGKDREKLYLRGGVLFITSRILVVDLLKKVCPIEKLSGIMVYDVHRVTDSSTEAFIIRLYREHNKVGFIKGFSDSPEHFISGYCKLERVLKNLFVKNIYLWPRFHAVVNASLEKHKPDVIELRQQMTPHMRTIQLSILDIIKACVNELKTSNPTLEAEDITVENCLGKSFDQVVKLQFDPRWDQLGYKAKQLIYDLKMLRTLLYFLTQYDCVTFCAYLESLRSSGSRAFTDQSSWIFMEAVDTLFVKSRERVYGKTHGESKSSLNLEESPKWKLLTMVLDEIEKERKDRLGSRDKGRVLIIVNDLRTCYQLRKFLCEGGRSLLLDQYDRLLAQKIKTSALPKAMLEELQPIKKDKVKDEQPSSKRKKLEEECEGDANESIFTNFQIPSSETNSSTCQVASNSNFNVLSNLTISIHPLTNSNNPYHLSQVLFESMPETIVMYDADVTFVRQIEVYKASHRGLSLRVYFLIYDSSVEEQKYLTSLRKEKEAFQHLIQQRAHMVVPADREGLVHDAPQPNSETSLVSSRKAGGRQDVTVEHSVIIDMREFRSSLPSLLHRKGINVIPITLEVGDYILTPDICVERKTVSDLIGSLNSGRLYKQALAMTRYYKKSILLIEFDEGKPFALQNCGPGTGVVSKLVLLILHFPKLRILWCPTPHATAELFEMLKVDQCQPDLKVAISISDELGNQRGQYNPAVQDFLLKLPGVNSRNYRKLMDKVHDFHALVSLNKKQLEAILENDINADLLWNCLHKSSIPTTTSNSRINVHDKERNKGKLKKK